MDRPTVSVCMATYNGARFLGRQLESILTELGPGDEVVVVDDCSRDDTPGIIEAVGDPRIRWQVNDANRREAFSFGRAMGLARNEVIFLSDQDDVWIPGRVARMTEALLDSGAWVVATNFAWMNDAEETLDVRIDGVRAADSRRHLKNVLDIFLGRTNYYGCAMAFRRELNRILLPIPAMVESHDLWVALAGNLLRKNVHLEEETLRKRQHGGNVTSPLSSRALYRKLWSRGVFAASLAVLAGRHLVRPR
jgi:glycosyltransferase involved in cell wall biosynthesis